MDSLAGTRLGRFRITRLIGKGGMGEVYAAVDEDLDRQVAIKVLGTAVDVEPHRRRFLREARLAARLNHPNIASIHEVGDSDGRRYIVMELLEGKTLRVLLNERRLTVDEALTIARDVARALARAHAGEVIHRDIKPENIFVTMPAPDVLLAKVLDFGLARDELMRSKNDEEDTATDLTGPGEACGTAGYLAPEQARGLAVDVRADIFSFGAVFYEMLTGKRAFDGRNQLARMLAVVKHPHEPLRSRVPDVSPEVEAVVERCLAKSAADRYADGSALLAAIEQILRGPRASSPDVASGRLELRSDLDPTGPKLPAAASASSLPAAQRDGSSASARAISNETPAPSTRSQRVHAHRESLLQRHWPLFAAAGSGLFVALLVIALSGPSRVPRSRSPVVTPRSPVVAAARELSEKGVEMAEVMATAGVEEPRATVDEEPAPESVAKPTKDPKPSPAFVPAVATAPRASARTDKRVGFTRLPNVPATPPAEAESTGPNVAVAPPVPPAPPAPSPPPPPPVETPKTGTIRFQGVDVLTIVVDGEHHRLRNDSVTVACGRHRVRVGLNNERIVDVPCGGSVLF